MEAMHGGDVYRHPNVLDFSANINPLGMPEGVKCAIAEHIEQAACYPDIFCESLRKKLAVFHKVSFEHIICGNGAADLIYRLVLAQRPKKAMLLAPGFAEYEQALRLVGAKVEVYPLNQDTWMLEEAILEQLSEDIDMLFLCNPNNPTGQLIAPQLLQRILKTCKDKHIFVLLDECFLDFYPEEKYVSMLQETENNEYLFVLRAFTKIYAMAGIRLGYGVCGNGQVLEAVRNAGAPWSVSVLAQLAGQAALEEHTYVKNTIALIEKEKQFFYQAFQKMNIFYWKGAANYIFFKMQAGMKEILLKKGILIRDCSNYRNLSDGYYRIAVKSHKDNEKLVQALKKSMQVMERQDEYGKSNYDTGNNVKCGQKSAGRRTLQNL